MIYDVRTSNKSFLKTSKELKDIGVRNNKFMLELYDESLVGVDPWSADLTNDQKISIYLEVCRNYWYFIREIIRIPVAGANIQYNLHLGNLSISYLRLKNQNLILEMPRQVGKTIGNIIFDTWAFSFGTKNSRLVYMHKDSGKNGVLKNVKDFGELAKNIPPFLNDLIKSPKGDIDNVESKFNAKHKNMLTMIGNPISHDEADKRGRGISTPIVFIDEFAFFKFFDVVFKALVPAWKQAAEFAKMNNVPYGLVLATTPGDPDSDVGKFALNMIENGLRWKNSYYDISDEELAELLKRNSKNDFFHLKFTHIECGKDDAFIQEALRANNNDWMAIRREYLLEWLPSFENSIFTQEELENVEKYIKKPVLSIRMKKYYEFEFYEKPNWKLNYIVGIDVAGGLANDYSTIVICHPDDFHVVGVFYNNMISTDDFTELIYEFATLYFPNSLLVIERNSYGLNILDRLMKVSHIERRLFKMHLERLAEKKIRDGYVVKEKIKQWVYGTQVTSNVRDNMMDQLSNWVSNHPEKIVSEPIYKELAQLQRDKVGKIVPPNKVGYHDDLIFGLLHILYACLQTKYMRSLFGITNIVGSPNAREDSNISDPSMITRVIENANMSAKLPSLGERELDPPTILSTDDDETRKTNDMLSLFREWNNT